MPRMDGGDVVWDIRGDLSDINAAMVQAEQNIQKSFGKAATYVGAAMTAIGFAIEGALLLSANAAMAWESAFTGVRKTVDGTEEEMAALSEGIIDLSKRIPVAATELAAFAEIGGQMGVPRDAILAFTETIAILGETTNLAGEEGAAMLAQFATVAQIPQDEYSNIAAALVALGNAGSSTEKDIMAMSQRLAAAGTIAGLSGPEIMGIANAMSSVGIEAEAGGTAFSKIFVDMKKSVETGKGNLQTFAEVAGVTAQQFAESFNTDPASAIVSFIQGLAAIEESGGSLFQILDELDYKEVRLGNATLSATMAANMFADSVKLGSTAFVENNAHLEEAEKRFATTESIIQMTKNSFFALAEAIGKVMLPSIQFMNQQVQQVLALFEKWAKDNPQLTQVLVILAGVLGGVLLAVGSMLILLGPLAAGFAVVSGATVVLGAKIIAIGAILGVAAYAAYQLFEAWGGFPRLMEMINGVLASAKEYINRNWEQITRIFDTARGAVGKIIEALASVIGIVFKAILTVMGASFSEIGEGWMTVAGATGEGAGTVLDFIEGMVTKGAELFTNFANIFIGFTGWLEDHWGVFAKICEWGSNLVMEPIFWLVDKVGWAIGNLVDGLSWLFGWMGSMWGQAPVAAAGQQLPQMATGGLVQRAGMALVGERGPEIVRLPRGSEVIPNHESAGLLGGGGGGGTTIQVNIDATIDLDSPGAVEKIARAIAYETSSRLRGAGVT